MVSFRTQAGLFRDLVHIVSSFGSLTALAATRRAFAACLVAAAPLRQWAAAVPSLTQLLATPAFATAGRLEAHGALWPLLLMVRLPSHLNLVAAAVDGPSPFTP